MQDSPSRKQDQFIVRLPDGMRDRIKAAAEANNRSMNAEIVATLEEKFPAPPDLADLRAILASLDAEIAKLPTYTNYLSLGADRRASLEDYRTKLAELIAAHEEVNRLEPKQ